MSCVLSTIKLYWQKQLVGQIWPLGYSCLIPDLEHSRQAIPSARSTLFSNIHMAYSLISTSPCSNIIVSMRPTLTIPFKISTLNFSCFLFPSHLAYSNILLCSLFIIYLLPPKWKLHYHRFVFASFMKYPNSYNSSLCIIDTQYIFVEWKNDL